MVIELHLSLITVSGRFAHSSQAPSVALMRHPPEKPWANPAGLSPRRSANQERTRTPPKAPRPSAALAPLLPIASRRSHARRRPLLNAHSAGREAGCRRPYPASVHHAAPFPSARAHSRAPTPPPRPAHLATLDTTRTTVTNVALARQSLPAWCQRAPTPMTRPAQLARQDTTWTTGVAPRAGTPPAASVP